MVEIPKGSRNKYEYDKEKKILCVPLGDPMCGHVKGLKDAPPHLLKEIENFFDTYKQLEGKETEVLGWEDSGPALMVIHEARQAYAQENSDI